MTRKEYLTLLGNLLLPLPSDEREAALSYYDEYFQDAGEEKEQEVIKELGKPEDLASFILSKFNCVPLNPPKEKQVTKIPSSEKKSTNKANIILIILAFLLTFPLWSPIFFGLFGIIIGLSVLTFLLSGIGTFVGGIASIVISVIIFFTTDFSVFTGESFVIMGTSFLLAGLGIVLINSGCNFFNVTLPKIIGKIVDFIVKLYQSITKNLKKNR